ncbi:hypothetical protein QF026_004077 [Streptomyces aurantiacus]|uniref:Mu transposase C-terminal domain-containing protein n=1 Tax=Streptomyces aurantiacus TaxID=47760 RepID=UPI00278E6595|nr:Mu transposase C-terminal domain-containing protein [Streptomyces aurantiacus]MDQ0775611.1 hypothetical protein [Streptomyces aurantiacus]
MPDRPLSPNEKYAALVSAAGYVPVALSPEEYIQLMPREWRVIGRSGVRINNRTYDAPGLAPFRRQPSGQGPDGKLWEVHYDPYDISCVWVRNHHGTGWITVTWRHLRTSPVPMSELVFDRAHQILTERGQRKPDEDAVAQVAAELLDRASDGPDRQPARRAAEGDRRPGDATARSPPAHGPPASLPGRGQHPRRSRSRRTTRTSANSPMSSRWRSSTRARRPRSGGERCGTGRG